MLKKMRDLLLDESGQGMTEYAMILGAIAVIAIAVIIVLGPKIDTLFNNTGDALSEPVDTGI